MAAPMAVLGRGFLKKRHQIAVALQVSYGGAMAVVAEWRKWWNNVFF